MKRLIIGITGASGAVIGVRLLEWLSKNGIETHLIVSKWGRRTLEHETSFSFEYVSKMASYFYSSGDMAASISSGSFITDGMIIVPCSMSSLASISIGNAGTLIQRAADVIIKEKRKLVLVPREVPLSAIHIENMLKLAKLGVIILPPMPAFYNNPETLDDVINHIVSRILDQFSIENRLTKRWSGQI